MVKNKGKAWEVLQKERLNVPPHETPEHLAERALKKIQRAIEIDADDSADREISAGKSLADLSPARVTKTIERFPLCGLLLKVRR